MKLNYLGSKYKIILKTTPAFQTQLTKFFEQLPMTAIYVYFYNPFIGNYSDGYFYRGDRKVTTIYDIQGIGRLYDSTEVSLIEI